MRLPEGPWYRASRDAWYVEIDGRQVKLATGKANKKAALEAFHRRMALGPAGLPKGQELTVATSAASSSRGPRSTTTRSRSAGTPRF